MRVGGTEIQNEFGNWARNSGLQTGVSFGMAMVSKGENNLDDILRQADAALYDAKLKGCENSKAAPIVETNNRAAEGESFSEAAQLRSIPVTPIFHHGSGECYPPEQPDDHLQINLFNQLEKKMLDKETANQQLRLLVEEYRLQFENILDVVFMIGTDLNILSISPSVEKLLGYKAEDFIGQPVSDLSHILTPQSFKRAISNVSMMLKGKNIPAANYDFVAKDGTLKHAEIHGSPLMRDGQVAGTISVARDITERKHAEEALRESEEKYRLIFEYSPLGHFYFDEKGIIVACNDNFVKLIGSSKEAIVGINMLQLPDKKLVESIQKALNGDTAFYEDVYHSTTAGKATPVRAFFAPIKIGDKGILGGVAIIEDVTNHKRAEEDLKKSLEQLRRAMQATIQALSQIVETKDPYTSGHQKRTTNLARAIATEMHLSSDQIEGIRVAGAIHDIGKLSVPAEILSKPSKLAAAEYSLIKEHARQGYEILKDVESPWPLAEIVHQHHERMNGSGYPRGLQGEEILIEARILAVADVVEAMASYRPYRPALGIEKALEEIEKNKGVLYDLLAADACLRLFKEKGFKIN